MLKHLGKKLSKDAFATHFKFYKTWQSPLLVVIFEFMLK